MVQMEPWPWNHQRSYPRRSARIVTSGITHSNLLNQPVREHAPAGALTILGGRQVAKPTYPLPRPWERPHDSARA